MPRTVRPQSLAEAAALLVAEGEDALLVSGGTATVLMLRNGFVDPAVLVGLWQVRDDGFRAVSLDGGNLRIGGGVSLAEVASHPLVRDNAPALATACSSVGNIRVRNAATLGGNIAEADYASDPPAALVALDAMCETTGSVTRTRPVGEVITGYYETSLAVGELISAVIVPARSRPGHQSYSRFESRTSADRPCVGVAMRLSVRGGRVSDARLVLGGVTAVPHVVEAAALLVGMDLRRLDPELFARRAIDGLRPIGDERASSAYRWQMAAVHVERALREAMHSPEVVVSDE